MPCDLGISKKFNNCLKGALTMSIFFVFAHYLPTHTLITSQ